MLFVSSKLKTSPLIATLFVCWAWRVFKQTTLVDGQSHHMDAASSPPAPPGLLTTLLNQAAKLLDSGGFSICELRQYFQCSATVPLYSSLRASTLPCHNLNQTPWELSKYAGFCISWWSWRDEDGFCAAEMAHDSWSAQKFTSFNVKLRLTWWLRW